MAMVCRDWREVLCSQPSLWKSLSVGKGRSIEKAKCWMERSKGRIMNLRIEEGFDALAKSEVSVFHVSKSRVSDNTAL